MDCKSTKLRLDTTLGNYHTELNDVQVPLSRNDVGQNVNNDSVDNMEEHCWTARGDDPREEHHKDREGALNC